MLKIFFFRRSQPPNELASSPWPDTLLTSTKARKTPVVAIADVNRVWSLAHAALRLLQDTCDAAIDALQQPLSSTQIALLPTRPTPDVLHKDTQALLTLVYTSTTKVALVLRPATPAPAAALAPIADLGTSVTSLATCATLYGFHGATLSADARRLARDVVESVRAFAAGMVGGDAGVAGEGDYLVRTGAVHDLVERARKEMPVSNVDAVKRRWRVDREMVADAAGEVDAMLEDAAGEGDEDEDEEADELDEEWDELGFGSSKKMSPEEVERTKKVSTCHSLAVVECRSPLQVVD